MAVYLELLQQNRAYRNLWLARLISNLGDWFNLLASAALITALTGAGTAISYLFLARFLPVFVMSPFAGVLADRYERRLLMIVSDLLRAATVLCFLLVRSPSQIWLFYVLTVLQFILSSLYTPAHSALVSNIVQPSDLVTANALDSFTWSSMLAVGALLGGIAAATLGVTAAFIMDAATFVVSAWFVSRIEVAHRPPGEEARQGGFMDFVHGMRYLRARPFILTLSLVKAGGAFVWGAANVMEIPLATDIFPLGGNGALVLGFIYATVGIGTGVGPLVMRRYMGDGRNEALVTISLGFILLTVGMLGIGVATAIGWVLFATLVRSLGTGALWVFSSVLLMSIVADRFRGRVFAFEFAALTLTQSVSTVWAGFAYDKWGLAVQQVFILMGLISVIVTVSWITFQVRTVTRTATA